MKSNYTKFAIMLSISFIIMYTVMFFNVFDPEHVHMSTTRVYMAFLMVSPMAVVMLLMMPGMYKDKKLNTIILIGSVLVFILAFAGLQTQTFIGDKQYLNAMIPHHSTAILTSKRADLRDPEVQKLAVEIIQAQEEEIAQMKAILNRLDD